MSPRSAIHLPRPRVMLDLLEEHLEDLDFLWEQREGMLFASEWTTAELAALEERADAHLDALQLAGASAIELARPRAPAADRGLATAAALVMMSAADADLAAEVVSLLAAEGGAGDGARIALRHSEPRHAAGPLLELAQGGSPIARARASDVLAFHGLPTPRGFDRLVAADDLEARRLAHAAAGRFGGPWDPAFLEAALAGDDQGLRIAAFEASARLGSPDLPGALRAAATRADPCPDALRWLGVLGDRRDLPLLIAALDREALAAAAIAGLGALGDVTAAPALLARMGEPATAAAAGAAFVRLTGAPSLSAKEAASPPADLTEDEQDFRDEAPLLDPDRARKFWCAAAARFAPGARWQHGVDVTAVERRPELLSQVALETRRDLFLSARARRPDSFRGLEIEARVFRRASR